MRIYFPINNTHFFKLSVCNQLKFHITRNKIYKFIFEEVNLMSTVTKTSLVINSKLCLKLLNKLCCVLCKIYLNVLPLRYTIFMSLECGEAITNCGNAEFETLVLSFYITFPNSLHKLENFTINLVGQLYFSSQ